MLPEYRNEPFTDFTDEKNVAAFRGALESVKKSIGANYPLVIGEERIELDETFPSVNPARPDEVLGNFANGTAAHADSAIENAAEAFKTWKNVAVADRARYLLRASAEMRRRKHEFSAVMVLEVGKSWAEADADTAEAIDFIEYMPGRCWNWLIPAIS